MATQPQGPEYGRGYRSSYTGWTWFWIVLIVILAIFLIWWWTAAYRGPTETVQPSTAPTQTQPMGPTAPTSQPPESAPTEQPSHSTQPQAGTE